MSFERTKANNPTRQGGSESAPAGLEPAARRRRASAIQAVLAETPALARLTREAGHLAVVETTLRTAVRSVRGIPFSVAQADHEGLTLVTDSPEWALRLKLLSEPLSAAYCELLPSELLPGALLRSRQAPGDAPKPPRQSATEPSPPRASPPNGRRPTRKPRLKITVRPVRGSLGAARSPAVNAQARPNPITTRAAADLSALAASLASIPGNAPAESVAEQSARQRLAAAVSRLAGRVRSTGPDATRQGCDPRPEES